MFGSYAKRDLTCLKTTGLQTNFSLSSISDNRSQSESPPKMFIEKSDFKGDRRE